MKWVTRERPKTDRIACPWLIKNFIDPDAAFLDVPALRLLARIVHGADVADDRDATPQSRGLLAVAEGFHLLNLGDHRQLELSLPVYDALYAWCKQEVASSSGNA